MDREDFVKLQNKQIEEYRRLIGALEKSKNVINQFDGKMCNKRVNEALGGFDKENNMLLSIIDNYTIRAYTYSRGIHIGSCYSYIDYDELKVEIKLDTTNARPRIKAKETIEAINDKIENTFKRIELIKKDFEEYDNMMSEGQELIRKINEWKNKYGYTSRNSVHYFKQLNNVY